MNSNFKIGQVVENILVGANNKRIVVRIVGIIDVGGEQMFRVTDNLTSENFEMLKRTNQTWGAPVENIAAHDSDCAICHRDGLVWMR